MREIWFRGKRLDNGQWIEGWLIRRTYPAIETTLGYIVTKGRSLVIDTVYPVDPSTAGQYIGLTDKNGKMIFEGDIAEKHVQGNILVTRGVINWDQKNAGWAHQLNGMNPSLCLFDPKAWEVIGNIHDNPELLKGESK